MRNKLLFSNVKRIFESKEFSFIYMILFALSIINLIVDSGENYFVSILNIASYFGNIILLFCVGYNSYVTSKITGKSFSMITRYNDRKEYIDNLLKTNSIVTILVVSLYFMINIIMLTIKYFNNYQLISFYYDISIVVYLIFFIIRYIIIMMLLSNVFMFVIKNANKIFSSIIIISSLLFLHGPIYVASKIETFTDILFLPGYFLLQKEYSSFTLEISASLFMILLLLIINYALYIITCKRKKNDYLITD